MTLLVICADFEVIYFFLVLYTEIDMFLLVVCRDMEMVLVILRTDIEMVLGMLRPGIEMFLEFSSQAFTVCPLCWVQTVQVY